MLDSRGRVIAREASATATLLKSGLSQANRELILERPDGKRVTVLSNVAPLFDEAGAVAGALDVLQNITDHSRLEEARRLAERVTASARVATEVAQLKPSLLSIGSWLDLLGQDATLSVEARGYTELVRVELVRFDALVKHMVLLAGAS